MLMIIFFHTFSENIIINVFLNILNFLFLQYIRMNCLGHQSYTNENTETKYLIIIQKTEF